MACWRADGRTGGRGHGQVKKPEKLSFLSLRAALVAPGEFMETDFAKFGRSGLLHLGFRALHAFRAETGGASPRPASRPDSDRVRMCGGRAG